MADTTPPPPAPPAAGAPRALRGRALLVVVALAGLLVGGGLGVAGDHFLLGPTLDSCTVQPKADTGNRDVAEIFGSGATPYCLSLADFQSGVGVDSAATPICVLRRDQMVAVVFDAGLTPDLGNALCSTDLQALGWR